MRGVQPLVRALRSEFAWELRDCVAFLQREWPKAMVDIFDQVLVNDELLYVHYPQIGCTGLASVCTVPELGQGLQKIDAAGEPFRFAVNPAKLPANQIDAT